jgi:DNA-binding NarL/FixJ family response regulator
MYYRNITIIHRGDFVARFKLDRNTISEKNNKELSVDFLKSANEELVKENKELKKKIEELESRALINPRKVTDEQVKKIKELRASGLSYRAIVKEIGLSTCTIQRALKGIYD